MQWQWPWTPWKSCITQLTTTRMPHLRISNIKFYYPHYFLFEFMAFVLINVVRRRSRLYVSVSLWRFIHFFQFFSLVAANSFFSEFRIEMVYVQNHTESWCACNLYWMCMICIVHWYRFSDPDCRKSYQLNRESMCVVVNGDFADFFSCMCVLQWNTA